MINKVIVLIGPPGSGKGFFASWLQKNYHLNYISSGDICRNLVSEGNFRSKKVAAIINQGNLLSADLIGSLVDEKIKTVKQNFILDGFPRNLTQFDFWKKIIKNNELIKIYYLVLKCDFKICLERIQNRLICSNCKSVYNTKTKPPIKANQCDNDQTPLIVREDNKKIKERFNVFNQETVPLIELLKKNINDNLNFWELDTSLSNVKNFEFLKNNFFDE